jgi:hypothetical protein
MRRHFPVGTGDVEHQLNDVCISDVFFEAPAIYVEQRRILLRHVEAQVVFWSDFVWVKMSEELLVLFLFAC